LRNASALVSEHCGALGAAAAAHLAPGGCLLLAAGRENMLNPKP
jgi:hypothetical protein